jgi:hypothetical protein
MKSIGIRFTLENNPVGRPTLMTEETLKKLEDAFLVGASDKEACFIAGISATTLYNYQLAHPEYVERKEALKDMPKFKARKNIVEKINSGDVPTSQWYAERKAKDEFSQRNEQTGANGEALKITFDNAFASKTEGDHTKQSPL